MLFYLALPRKRCLPLPPTQILQLRFSSSSTAKSPNLLLLCPLLWSLFKILHLFLFPLYFPTSKLRQLKRFARLYLHHLTPPVLSMSSLLFSLSPVLTLSSRRSPISLTSVSLRVLFLLSTSTRLYVHCLRNHLFPLMISRATDPSPTLISFPKSLSASFQRVLTIISLLFLPFHLFNLRIGNPTLPKLPFSVSPMTSFSPVIASISPLSSSLTCLPLSIPLTTPSSSPGCPLLMASLIAPFNSSHPISWIARNQWQLIKINLSPPLCLLVFLRAQSSVRFSSVFIPHPFHPSSPSLLFHNTCTLTIHNCTSLSLLPKPQIPCINFPQPSISHTTGSLQTDYLLIPPKRNTSSSGPLSKGLKYSPPLLPLKTRF